MPLLRSRSVALDGTSNLPGLPWTVTTTGMRLNSLANFMSDGRNSGWVLPPFALRSCDQKGAHQDELDQLRNNTLEALPESRNRKTQHEPRRNDVLLVVICAQALGGLDEDIKVSHACGKKAVVLLAMGVEVRQATIETPGKHLHGRTGHGLKAIT
eukprot:CAMPEP_0170258628 /NCGR_PEP_ID=MMETSP0116_2-20130129/29180_1 /TAXON_ID=400756 /ORGANISM="Durinskia baltica, Strain CSIRO CS-38" /LENGTH=155 /DNA_ID=CAMNT_0010509663 /DNA_START=526 /DNA_END=995 /DNA_ORIENTATION=+